MSVSDDTLHAMDRFGGSFVLALAKLYRVADSMNRLRIEAAFDREFRQYTEMAQRAREQGAR